MSNPVTSRPAEYEELLRLLRDVANLSGVSNLLSWDQEAMMPPRAGAYRAEQIAIVTRVAHERAADPRIGELLDVCEADPSLTSDPATAANLREMRRDFDRILRLPAELAVEMSETTSLAMEAWKKARAASDFETFRPLLERQFELARRKAACFDGLAEPYDCLLQDYEPHMTSADLDRIFRPLRHELIDLLDEIDAAPGRPSDSLQRLRIPVDQQEAFADVVLKRLGFEFDGGRVDVSTHPFSTSIGPGDTRLTTRYSGERLLDALSSTMHEAGHAMYEQGLPKKQHHGEPLGENASLGIHESQSRLWENEVGRSLAFWQWALPEARRAFADNLDPAVTPEAVHEAVNVVRRDLIRTESDEVTYNLHIMLRFDLERAMISGDLAVADLPAAWNERMKKDLHVDVPDDARGCLQDIHWAMGGIGYFPSYALGNIYAAQMWEAIRRDVTDLDDCVARGEFSPLLGWLRSRIHQYGRRFPAMELCRRATGQEVSHRALIDRLRSRVAPIYELSTPVG